MTDDFRVIFKRARAVSFHKKSFLNAGILWNGIVFSQLSLWAFGAA